MSVSTKPGETQFTRMPLGARSVARPRVMPANPDLAATYEERPGFVMTLQIDAMLMIHPRRVRRAIVDRRREVEVGGADRIERLDDVDPGIVDADVESRQPFDIRRETRK